MTRNAGTSCAGRLEEASFCSINDHDDQLAALRAEKRRATRYVLEEPVVLETQEGDLFGAVVMNYSQNGLYFESERKVQQGAVIKIRNEATLACPNGGGCFAEVRWSKPVGEKPTEYLYGSGARYC